MLAPPESALWLQILVAAAIHLLVPAAGAVAFVRLLRRMATEAVPAPPVARLLLLFVAYGGWLMVLLTGAFWFWSGAASLGLAFLLLPAPMLLIWAAVRTRSERALSPYHRLVYRASLAYAPGVLAVVVLGSVVAHLVDRA